MIALSDAVLVVASAAALATGLYRWQNNLDQQTPGSTSVVEAVQVQPAPVQAVPPVPVPAPQTQANSTLDSAPAPADLVVEEIQTAPVIVPEVPQPPTENELTAEVTEKVEATTSELAIEAPEIVEPPRIAVGTHTVASGDTLNRIAYRYGTTVAIIREINQLEDTVITIGEDLYYPLPDQ